jgi:hypothetical protein
LSLIGRVGSGTPETFSWIILQAGQIDKDGRMAISANGYPLKMAAYIIDVLHILVVSTDPPQVNPLMSGTITRD